MELKTPLYDAHVKAGGKIVPFAGYLLPVQYETGVIKEHMAVRTPVSYTHLDVYKRQRLGSVIVIGWLDCVDFEKKFDL